MLWHLLRNPNPESDLGKTFFRLLAAVSLAISFSFGTVEKHNGFRTDAGMLPNYGTISNQPIPHAQTKTQAQTQTQTQDTFDARFLRNSKYNVASILLSKQQSWIDDWVTGSHSYGYSDLSSLLNSHTVPSLC